MTGNKQQQTHTKTLKAGIPMNIDQPCEFIFIDQGEDLDFVIGDSRLSGRKAGDFARFDVPVENVRVTSPYDQTIKIVLGFGEFSRLIVSGELNVSSYVTMQGGEQALSLPMEVTRTVGYDSLTPEAVEVGTEVVTGPQLATGNYFYAGFWWDDYYYGLSETGYYKIGPNTTAGTYEETGAFGVAMAGDPTAAAVTDKGELYVIAGKDLYKMQVGEWYPVLVASDVNDDYARYGGGYDPVKNQAAFLSDYATVSGEVSLTVVDVATGAVSVRVVNAGVPGTKMLFRRDLGEWWIQGGGTAKLDRDFNLLSVGVGEEALKRASDWSHDGVWLGGHAGDAARRASIAWGQDAEYTAKLWTQEGADESTRRNVYAQDAFNIFPRDGEQVVAGPLIKQVLHSLVTGAPENYLNYVTGFSYTDGRVKRSVSSGTQTFAARGIPDDFAVKMNTEFTVEFLPEYLDL